MSSEEEYDSEGYDDSEEEDSDEEYSEEESGSDDGSDEEEEEKPKEKGKPRIQFDGFPGAIQLPVGPNCRVSIRPSADDNGFSIIVNAGVHQEYQLSLSIADNTCSVGQTTVTQTAPTVEQTQPVPLNTTRRPPEPEATQPELPTLNDTQPTPPPPPQPTIPDIKPSATQIARPDLPTDIRGLYRHSVGQGGVGQSTMGYRTVDVSRPLSEQMADIVFT